MEKEKGMTKKHSAETTTQKKTPGYQIRRSESICKKNKEKLKENVENIVEENKKGRQP